MSSPELSRRWVLQLGYGAVLTGFSGKPGKADEPLPPGVFLPSTNHLAHALKAAASARPLASYVPRFFAPAEFETVRTLVAALLGGIPNAPAVTREITSWIDLTVSESAAVRAAAAALTPAHRALAVAYYGPASVHLLESFDAQSVCREGLRAINGALPPLQPLLDRAASTKPEAQDPATRFVDYLRAMAIDGYYTSREGLRELDYKGNSFYSESPGCTHVAAPVSPAGR